MNKTKKFGLLLIGMMIITPLFSQSVSCTLTFGGQSIEVSAGDHITWRVTNASASSKYTVGDLYKVNFRGIGQYYGLPGINTSIDYYNITSGTWRVKSADLGMFTYNITSGNFSIPYSYTQLMCLMVPPNCTLTALGWAILEWGPPGFNVNGNILNISSVAGFSYIEVNTYGIVTKWYSDKTSSSHIIEYVSSSLFPGGNIPFGTTFLAFGILGVLCVSIVVKKRTRLH